MTYNKNKIKKKNYIIVFIIGGLGNQILQYIFGKSLANKLGCSLILDTSFSKLKIPKEKYKKKNPNKFLLKLFRLQNISIKNNIFKIHIKFLPYLRFLNFSLTKKIISLFFKKKIKNFYYDYTFTKNNIHRKLLYSEYKKDSYFYGYWQKILHSNLLDKKVLNEFSLKKKLLQKSFEKKIINKKNIAIHIRGNDYLFKKNRSYDIADTKFYEKAINFYYKKILNPKFHIFTDDQKYADKILFKFKNYKNFIFMKKNNNEINDFEALRNYYNYIIPNSTFSYTASFLSRRKKTTIILPKKWKLLQKIRLPKTTLAF
jgi:hypothetical protein